jgi:hypothetical protein
MGSDNGGVPYKQVVSLAASLEASNKLSNDRGRRRQHQRTSVDHVQQLMAKMRKHERQIAFPDTEVVTFPDSPTSRRT